MSVQGGERYPFTPFPRAWYFVDSLENLHKKKSLSCEIFGKLYTFSLSDFEKGSLADIPLASHGGLLFAYYGGEKPIFSLDEVPSFKGIENRKDWVQPFQLEFKARVHIQEVAENALDLAHFSRVHAYTSEPELLNFEMDRHTFTVTIKARRNILGFIDEPVMKITYFGMGIVIASVVSKPVELDVLLTSTPIDGNQILIRHWISIRKKSFIRDNFFRALLPRHIRKDFFCDIPIWENKLYYKAPLLCPMEKNIVHIRHWAQQFY